MQQCHCMHMPTWKPLQENIDHLQAQDRNEEERLNGLIHLPINGKAGSARRCI